VTFLPISLGVRRPPEAGTMEEKSPTKAQAEKILNRDDYTCRFCGFRSEQYQRVIFAAEPREFVASCTFCEQCLYLERTGLTGTGALLWLPEIGQAELNHIARAIYIARATNDKIAEDAAKALEALSARKAEVKKRLGSDDPLLLATALHESLSDEEYQGVATKLDGVRFLASDKHVARGPKGDADQFPAMIKYWCSGDGPYADLPASKWLNLFKSAAASAGHA